MKKLICVLCCAIVPFMCFARGKKDAQEENEKMKLPEPEQIGPGEGAGRGAVLFIEQNPEMIPEIPVAQMKSLEPTESAGEEE